MFDSYSRFIEASKRGLSLWNYRHISCKMEVCGVYFFNVLLSINTRADKVSHDVVNGELKERGWKYRARNTLLRLFPW